MTSIDEGRQTYQFGVSVVIPCWNSRETLERTFGSIAHQKYRDHEIVFVDDGSIDGSPSFAKSLLKKFDLRGRVIGLSENRGVSNARNVGLMNARGKYVNFFDADDRMESNFLDVAFSRLEEDAADFFGCGYMEQDTNGRVTRTRIPRKCSREKIALEYLRGISKFHIIGTVFRRDFLLGNGLDFNLTCRYAQDQEFLIKSLALVDKAIIYPSPLVVYIQHDDQNTRKAKSMDIFESELKAFSALIEMSTVKSKNGLFDWINYVEIPRIHISLLKNLAKNDERRMFYGLLANSEFRSQLRKLRPLHRRAFDDFLKSILALHFPGVFFQRYYQGRSKDRTI